MVCCTSHWTNSLSLCRFYKDKKYGDRVYLLFLYENWCAERSSWINSMNMNVLDYLKENKSSMKLPYITYKNMYQNILHILLE